MVTYSKWMSRASSVTVAGGTGGKDLHAAAEIIADRARELAATWSAQVPGRIRTEVHGNVAVISCDAPPAYPNEVKGVRHPVFAHGHDRLRWTWVTNEYRPFLAPAARDRASAAAARYADKIDQMARRHGFREAA